MKLDVQIFGLVPYRAALDYQRRLRARRAAGEIGDTLLLLEHPPVVTLGTRGRSGDILADRAGLEAAGVDVVAVERGGQVTYHGPGQLVGYLIIGLKERQRRIRRFVADIEGALVDYLAAAHGIAARADPDKIGVWAGEAKVAAVGIAIKEAVSFHGFALNLNTDLSHFAWIVPCGLAGFAVTSVEALTGRPVDLDRARLDLAAAIAARFGYDPPRPTIRRAIPD